VYSVNIHKAESSLDRHAQTATDNPAQPSDIPGHVPRDQLIRSAEVAEATIDEKCILMADTRHPHIAKI